jgi:hypothetical protein
MGTSPNPNWQRPKLRFGLLATVAVAVGAALAPALAFADTFVVKNTDNGGADSLRRAISDANGNAGADTIRFRISGAGVKTIKPASPLPEIVDPLTLNGYSQPGASPNTLATGNDANLLIQLNGAGAEADADGLTVATTDTTVRGLVVNRFEGAGIRLDGLSGAARNSVVGNFVGTDVSGTAIRGNEDGVVIAFSGADDNTVGGVSAGDRNVISGNAAEGVQVSGGLGTTGNQVVGNYIGTDRNGTADLGNRSHGVLISTVNDNVVGGTAAEARNVISGNEGDGVRLAGAFSVGIPTGNQVLGNLIGTDVGGTTALGNTGSGVALDDARFNSIGGGVASARNVISGNGDHGVAISGNLANGNLVLGNYLGAATDGTSDLGNGGDGVHISSGADENEVGGANTEKLNVISGNDGDGVEIVGGLRAADNQVLGNHIGTDEDGTGVLRNGEDGVQISGAESNTVGGLAAGARNVISANADDGVEIGVGAFENEVLGNFIGVDSTGNAALGNLGDGVDISQADDNVVGGTTAAARNVISGNDDDGVVLFGSDSTGNRVQGNFIGVGQDGTTALGNDDGIAISSANGSTIGGTATGAGNRIAQNQKDGVFVFGGSAVGNSVLSNSIFSNGDAVAPHGELGIDLASNGVTANDTDDGDSSSSSNRLQNFPVITSARKSTTNPFFTTIRGRLNSTPNRTFTIQCFVAGPAPDTSGHGEGQILVAQDTVTTDAGGDSDSFACISPVPQNGQAVTATATNTTTGDTSEFALNVGVTPGP